MRSYLNLLIFPLIFGYTTESKAVEICRYSGNSSHSGQIDVITRSSENGTDSDLQVLLQFRASALFQKIDYRSEELSHWHQGKLSSVEVNTRSLVNGSVKKQTWDHLSLDRSGSFVDTHIQASKPEELAKAHALFSSHWDPSSFGLPWLADFLAASPDRRTDFDLAAADYSPALKTPMALGFIFVRSLAWQKQDAKIFLAGQKHQKRLDVELEQPALDRNGIATWLVPLQIGQVQTPQDQPARFQVSKDQRLHEIDLTVVHALITVQGHLTLQSCSQ